MMMEFPLVLSTGGDSLDAGQNDRTSPLKGGCPMSQAISSKKA